MTDVTRDEFDALQGRVAVLERETTGEMRVTRHILEQVRHNSADLAALLGRADRSEARLDGLESEVRGVKHEVAQLRRDMPGIVAETMREVLREERET